MERKQFICNSFIFYGSFYEAISELPLESQGRIYDAIFKFAFEGKESELSGVDKAVFTLIKPQLIANRAKYENGCKGGRPKKQTECEADYNLSESDEEPNSNQTETEVKPNKNLSLTKPKPNENDNENVNENYNNNPPVIINNNYPPMGENTHRFMPPSVDEIKTYCESRKNGVDAEKFFDFYSSKGWMIGKNKMKDWKAAVRTWEKSGSLAQGAQQGGGTQSPLEQLGEFLKVENG